MAEKETLIVEIIAKGLKEVSGEIRSLRSELTGTEKVSRTFSNAQAKITKANKGVAELTNNSTKAFSKQAGIVSGLVPIYASVAANVFALSATFIALRKAADFDILAKSTENFSKRTGIALDAVAKDIQKITFGMLSLEDARKKVAIGVAAGFDSSTIEDLAKAATKASIGLGRDLTDSINRVFQGALKAEPELLDELGIILRLQPATKKYADELGKTVNQLSTFEKQQAVVNEVIRQANEKFIDVSNTDLANPFTQLAATFTQVSKSGLVLLNTVVEPLVSFLANNFTALAAVIALFASSILKKAIPSLQDFGQIINKSLGKNVLTSIKSLSLFEEEFKSFKNAVAGTKTENARILKAFSTDIQKFALNIKNTVGEKFGKTIGVGLSKAIQQGLKVGFTNPKVLENLRKSLQASLNLLGKGQVALGLQPNEQNITAIKASLASVVQVQGIIKAGFSANEAQAINFFTRFKTGGISAFKIVSSASTIFFSELSAGFLGGLSKGFNKNIKILDAFKLQLEESALATKSLLAVFASSDGKLTVFERGLAKTIQVLRNATGIFGIFVGSFLKFIPVIGQAVLAFDFFSSIFGRLTDALGLGNKSIERLNDTIDSNKDILLNVSESTKVYADTLSNLPDTLDNTNRQLKNQKNRLGDLVKVTQDLADKTSAANFGAFSDIPFFGSLTKTKDQIISIVKAFREQGTGTKKLGETLKAFGDISSLSGDQVKTLSRALVELEKEQLRTKNSSLSLNEAQQESFKNLNKNIAELSGGLPKLSAVEKSIISLKSTLVTLSTIPVSAGIEQITNLSSISPEFTKLADRASFLNDKLTIQKDKLDSLETTRANLSGFNKIFINPDVLNALDQNINLLITNVSDLQHALDNLGKNAAPELIQNFIDTLQGIKDKSKNATLALIDLNSELNTPGQSNTRQLDILNQIKNKTEEQINQKLKLNAINLKQAESELKTGSVSEKQQQKLLQLINQKNKLELSQKQKIAAIDQKIAAIESKPKKAQEELNSLNTQIKARKDGLSIEQAKIKVLEKEFIAKESIGEIDGKLFAIAVQKILAQKELNDLNKIDNLDKQVKEQEILLTFLQSGLSIEQAQVETRRQLLLLSIKDEKQRERVNKLIDKQTTGKKQIDLLTNRVNVLKRLGTDLQNAFANSFENIFQKGIKSFSDLATEIGNVFKRLFAKLAAEAIAKPIIVPVVQSLGGAILGSAAGNAAASSLGTGGVIAAGGALGTFGSTFGTALTTTIANPASIGTTLSAGGTLLAGGNIAAGLGAIAAPAAAIASAALAINKISGGKLFGTGFKKKLDTLVINIKDFVVSGEEVIKLVKKKSFFRGNKTKRKIQDLPQELKDNLSSLFNSLDDFLIKLSRELGRKFDSNFDFSFRGQVGELKDSLGKSIQNSLIDAFKDFGPTVGTLVREKLVTKVVPELVKQPTKEQQLALNSLPFRNSIATRNNILAQVPLVPTGNLVNKDFLVKVTEQVNELQLFISKLDFSKPKEALKKVAFAANFLSGKLFGLEKIPQAKQALNDLNNTFDDLISQARLLGLSTNAAEEARQTRIKKLTTDFNTSIADQILAIEDPLQSALNVEKKAADDRLENARIFGANIVAVEKLNELNRQSILDDFAKKTKDLANKVKQLTLNIKQNILDIVSPFQALLLSTKTEAEKRLADAKELGISLTQTELLNALDRQKKLKDFLKSSTSELFSAIGNVSTFISGLKLSSLSPLTPQQRLAEAQGQFNTTLGLAQGGDIQAINAITDSANTLLTEASSFFASSTDFTDIFNQVTASLQSIVNSNRDPVVEQLIASGQQSVENTQVIVDAIKESTDEIKRLNTSNVDLHDLITRFLAAQAPV